MSRIATLSLETILNDAQAIEKKALSLSVQLGPDDQEAMKTSLAFWRGRIAANRTMADNTGLIADQTKTGLVALNLGAAHTRGVADRFSEQERPFAVVRPASLDTPGLGIDLDLESLEGIEQRASLFSEGLIADLQRIFPWTRRTLSRPATSPGFRLNLSFSFLPGASRARADVVTAERVLIALASCA